MDVCSSEGLEKKPRKRMKSLFSKICEQMEFYFSDSNLHRDRFMKKITSENNEGYVDISLFLNFNKIKALTTDASAVKKALRLSDLLQVSEDGQRVRRSKPVVEPKQLDERTVYVECLPYHVDHMWIKRIFSVCGKVLYVSIPTYKTSGDPKGFAFVEFETVEGAKKACEELNNPPVEADGRPGKFPKTRKQLLQLQRKFGAKVSDDIDLMEITEGKEIKDTSKIPDSPTKASKRQKRRRRQTSESSVDGTVSDTTPQKRRKTVSTDTDQKVKGETETDRTENTEEKKEIYSEDPKLSDSSDKKASKISKKDDDLHSDEENKKPRKTKKQKSKSQSDASQSVTDSEADLSITAEGTESEVKKRKINEGEGHVSQDSSSEAKKRKLDEILDSSEQNKDDSVPAKTKKQAPSKKRKRKKRKHKERDIPELRVIPKKDWLELRNEYLSLQKKSMANLKQTLTRIRKDSENDQSCQTVKDFSEMDSRQAVGEKVSQAGQSTTQSKPKVEYIPNVIVSVSSVHPITRKQIKEYFGDDGGVAYVDLIEGDCTGYIRFKDAEKAAMAAKCQTKAYSFTLVQGECEMRYWSKLQSDREAKLTNKKSKKKRGTQKLVEKAQKISKESVQRKHIVFDD